MARKRNTEISIAKQKYLQGLANKVKQEKIGLYFSGDLFKPQYSIDETAGESVVQQPKAFVSAIYRLSILESKLLEFLFLKFKETGYCPKFKIKAIDFVNKTNLQYGSNSFEVIAYALANLSHLQFINLGDRFQIVNFFDHIELAPDNPHYKQVTETTPWDELEVSFGMKMTEIMTQAMKKNFVLIPFHKINCINNNYSLRYYKFALMYMYNKGRALVTKNNAEAQKIMKFAKENNIDLEQSWLFTFTPDELRMTFYLDENEYRDEKTGGNNKYFAENLVKKPIADLNKSVDDLQIIVQTVYNGKNRASGVKYWVFWCTSIDTTRFWLCPKCRKKNEISHTRCECNYDREKGRRMTQAEIDEENEEAERNFARISLRFASEK